MRKHREAEKERSRNTEKQRSWKAKQKKRYRQREIRIRKPTLKQHFTMFIINEPIGFAFICYYPPVASNFGAFRCHGSEEVSAESASLLRVVSMFLENCLWCHGMPNMFQPSHEKCPKYACTWQGQRYSIGDQWLVHLQIDADCRFKAAILDWQ